MFGCPTPPHTRERFYTIQTKEETRLDTGRNDVQLISNHSSGLLTEDERLAGRCNSRLFPGYYSYSKRLLVVSKRGSALTSVARHVTARSEVEYRKGSPSISDGPGHCSSRRRIGWQVLAVGRPDLAHLVPTHLSLKREGVNVGEVGELIKRLNAPIVEKLCDWWRTSGL